MENAHNGGDLAHFGVKGMRWGVRKQRAGGSGRKSARPHPQKQRSGGNKKSTRRRFKPTLDQVSIASVAGATALSGYALYKYGKAFEIPFAVGATTLAKISMEAVRGSKNHTARKGRVLADAAAWGNVRDIPKLDYKKLRKE